MLSQQDQEIWQNVPDPLFAGGSHFCGSGAGDKTIMLLSRESSNSNSKYNLGV